MLHIHSQMKSSAGICTLYNIVYDTIRYIIVFTCRLCLNNTSNTEYQQQYHSMDDLCLALFLSVTLILYVAFSLRRRQILYCVYFEPFACSFSVTFDLVAYKRRILLLAKRFETDSFCLSGQIKKNPCLIENIFK